DTFVGRRRTIQRALSTLRQGGRGLLAHGIGNLGKSSLAARIATRLTDHRTVVVVSPEPEQGSANARVIFDQLKAAADDMADAMPFDRAESLRGELAKMQAVLTETPEKLEDILRSLLAGPFRKSPIFLVLDDFEHSLQTPTAETPVVQPEPHLLADLRAVFSAFARPGVNSRLMVTCRYDFRVPDTRGQDLTRPFVERIPLPPMSDRERVKQWQARELARDTKQGETAEAEDIDEALVRRILAASGGNPGLQEVLSQPLLKGAAVQAKAALETVEAFLQSGDTPPEGEDVGDFFTRMTYEVYEGALDGTTRLALSVARVFSPGVPIPRAALSAAMAVAGIAGPEAALDTLLALGLLDDHGLQAGWRGMSKRPHAAINPLARPL
ncbi:MAG: ATP-binding protein, partial [Rhodobacteraceae bacterium]|nr:ATP-binding protein [Paracoccaceae bacterium]